MTLELVKRKAMKGVQRLEIPLEKAHELLKDNHFQLQECNALDCEFWSRNDVTVFVYPDGSYTVTLEAL